MKAPVQVTQTTDLFGSGLAYLLNNIQRLEASRVTIVSDIIAAIRQIEPEATVTRH